MHAARGDSHTLQQPVHDQLAAETPIEPVRVAGKATITSAGMQCSSRRMPRHRPSKPRLARIRAAARLPARSPPTPPPSRPATRPGAPQHEPDRCRARHAAVPTRCRCRPGAHRTAPRTAGRDGAANLDQRNVAAAVRRRSDLAAGPPSIGEQQLDLAARSGHRLVRLIAVAEPVDQTGSLCLRCGTWTGVDQLADLIMSQPSRIGDGFHRVAEDRLGQPLQSLAMCRGELLRNHRSAAFLYSCRCSNCGSMPSRSSVPRTKGVSMPTPSRPTPPPGCSHSSPKAVAKTYAAMSRDPPSPSSPPRPASACRSPRTPDARTSCIVPHGHIPPIWRSAQRHAGPLLHRAVRATSDAAAGRPRARNRATDRLRLGQRVAQSGRVRAVSAAVGREGSHGVNRRPSPAADRNPSQRLWTQA